MKWSFLLLPFLSVDDEDKAAAAEGIKAMQKK